MIVKLVCRNMTMEQFAEQMPALDTGIWYPVQDGTGLEGAWDFTLNYDAMARLAAMPLLGAAQPPADAGEASDPWDRFLSWTRCRSTGAEDGNA